MREKIKILGIAPYVGMKELMLDIADRRDDIRLEVFVGDLSDGVALVQEHQGRGFSGIVSRGGTAEMIRRVANIPVSEVELSVYDILRAIKLAQSYNGKFAIVGFPSITQCSKILCDLLQYQIDIVTVKSGEDVKAGLEKLKGQGCSMVLGDMITTVNAKLAGMNGVLITSGGESIEAAFDHAVDTCKEHKKNLDKINFLNALLFSLLSANLSANVSKNKEIAVFSESGEVQLSTSDSLDEDTLSFMRKNVSAVIDKGEKKMLMQKGDDDIVTLTGKGFSVNEERYCTFTVTHMPKSHVYDGQGVTFQNKMDLIENISGLFCRSNSVGNSDKIAERYGSADLPVLIVGEPGTGKDKTANSIYVNSKLSSNPMVSVDCRVVSEKKWSQLLEDEYSPFAEEKLTIYIKNVDQLNESAGVQIMKYFESTDICERNRMIFSCAARREVSPFCSALKNTLSCLVLKLQPLRQRPNDIPSLCSLYINEINSVTGKGVIGLTPEAMKLLQDYHWECNVTQLQRILSQLVVISDSPYISARDAAEALAAEGERKHGLNRSDLNLTQPLDDITKNVVRIVLSEEGMSRSKAARRLQISRSTLWRMLRE